MEAASPRSRIEFARNNGGGSRVVDIDSTFFHAFKGPTRSKSYRSEVVVIADAAEHKVRAFGSCPRSGGRLSAELCHPLLGLCTSAVVDGKVVTASPGQMSCHGIAHDAESDKCNF
jgi:hypothetical protein